MPEPWSNVLSSYLIPDTERRCIQYSNHGTLVPRMTTLFVSFESSADFTVSEAATSANLIAIQ